MPSENVLLFVVADSNIILLLRRRNRVRSCLHAAENMVDDNKNNRDIFYCRTAVTRSRRAS